MTIRSGTRIGSYEVLGPLGTGGMGEVYRARDGKLQRDVALKILPASFATDPDRLARFRREAQVLASLNHPHIGAIYGFEESTSEHALVLELVEGPTLADRIAQGPIPIEEALPIARQIAEALEAAHERGIIHRDLKPANIKLRPDGAVKVLDFGLAKLTAANTVPGGAGASLSPTITSPAMMTGTGMLLGTAAYMSPEQARGREADKRSDIWAFGAVVYEMLTGQRAFDGEDMTEVLGAVVRLEPKWDNVPADVPAAIRTLLQRSLVKDPRHRVADIAAARFVLEHHALIPSATPGSTPRPLWRRILPVAAALAVGAAGAGGAGWFLSRTAQPHVVRTVIPTLGPMALALAGADRDVAITPDGSRVIYRGTKQILVRALDQLQPTAITGLDAPRGVFTSPDGEWIGFFDGSRLLKKVRIVGGPAETIASVDGGGPRGATWGPDGSIVFATNVTATGLQRVASEGGVPVTLTKPDRTRGEADHLWPEYLTGGKAVLFTIMPTGAGLDGARIAVLDLATRQVKRLVVGSHAHYTQSGHLVYGVAGMLLAVPFDLNRLEVTGPPSPVLDDVITSDQGSVEAATALNGSLVYVSGVAAVSSRQTIVSMNRGGQPSPLPGIPTDGYREIRISPTGDRLALATDRTVLIYDIARGSLKRLTSDPARNQNPVWTPNGQRIIFTSLRSGYPELFWREADGTGRDERLLTRSKDSLLNLRANSWSVDGKYLQVTEAESELRARILRVAIDRPSEVSVLVDTGARVNDADVSPDGRWIAYENVADGQSEVYVERYPEKSDRTQISTQGGKRPHWSQNTPELFFVSRDDRQILSVTIQSGPTLNPGNPKEVFDVVMRPVQGSFRPYDVGPDGQFFVIRPAVADQEPPAAPTLIFVQNWFEELKRQAPVR